MRNGEPLSPEEAQNVRTPTLLKQLSAVVCTAGPSLASCAQCSDQGSAVVVLDATDQSRKLHLRNTGRPGDSGGIFIHTSEENDAVGRGRKS